jgi:hypothetical protein
LQMVTASKWKNPHACLPLASIQSSLRERVVRQEREREGGGGGKGEEGRGGGRGGGREGGGGGGKTKTKKKKCEGWVCGARVRRRITTSKLINRYIRYTSRVYTIHLTRIYGFTLFAPDAVSGVASQVGLDGARSIPCSNPLTLRNHAAGPVQ